MIQPEPRFDGSTHNHARDFTRLSGLLEQVRDLMADGKWRTLPAITEAIGATYDASVSARLRDLRKANLGASRLSGGMSRPGFGNIELRHKKARQESTKRAFRHWKKGIQPMTKNLTLFVNQVILELRHNKMGNILALSPRLANANFLRQVKLWHSRRSFKAVAKSCVINLTAPDTRKFNNCEANPTFEGGINSVFVTWKGAVLPAVVKWLLITGLVENILSGVTNSPLNDNYCLK